MIRNTSKTLKRAVLMMAPLLLIACEKPTNSLGYNQVIKNSSGLNSLVYDSIVTYTQALDSLLVAAYETQSALGGYTGDRIVGSISDGQFGRTEASFVTQFSLDKVDPDFGTNPNVDSVFLFLDYNGAYGDTSLPITLEVYELDEQIRPNGAIHDIEGEFIDSAFYSNYEPVEGRLIASEQFVPRPNKPIRIEGVKTDPTLKLNLDTNFFQEKFADVGDGTFPSFSSNEEFRKYFKGVHVRATNIDGSILYFNLNSANTRVRMYFHNDEDTVAQVVDLNAEQTSSDLPIGFSTFRNDYSGSYPVAFDLANMDTVAGEEVCYVQAMGGLTTVFEIPNLEYLSDSLILINKAELIVNKQKGVGFASAPPRSLEIREYTSRGPYTSIVDFTSGIKLAGNGSYQTSEVRNGKYVFDITRYVFEIVNGSSSKKLSIVPFAKSTVADRVILQGGVGANSPFTLKIYYTKP